ncbi:MAG: threonine/homoserine/homoserine lactone efflux protein [Sulfurimonas sp.]|jgi:threonine/homoserine/homoserine lactone efflux protein|uniref:LysE family translocator n=1 Tax=Sulfurimonas sp. TaxID=2022749 RepID=UPI0039E2CF67
MLPIETTILFFTTSIILALMPGPDNLFVLTHSALHGFKSGMIVILGLCTGVFIHTIAVTLGVSVIFQTSQVAFDILKVIGAVYLLYLAWQAFKAASTSLDNKVKTISSAKKLYFRGILMSSTNPKVAIFFLAFLPQFADPLNGSITIQMLILGTMFNVAGFLVFSIVSFFAGHLGEWLKNSQRAQTILNRIAGTIFMGFAIKLAVSER